MAFDFKKEFKEYYLPKDRPEILEIPLMNFIAVRGKGNPGDKDGEYAKAVGILYAIAYTLKMSYKGDYEIKGFFEYVVPPLEGFWWQEGIKGVDYAHKDTFHWISVIRLPDFVSEKDFIWAKQEAGRKKKMDCSAAEFLTIEEGLCVQALHTGSYDNEPETVSKMNLFLSEQGYEEDLSDQRLHHEIYLSDPRKTKPEKCRTVIRHPVRMGK
ncbi:MAG TPA: GyrI-like domain-containing protein [Lachnospiraceae bacterium]|nr:GyrI-like domain-containing protein [Lachnospiraceae bacterium]